jgi:type I restriction enzyme S subunit
MKLVKRRLGDIAKIIGGATPSTKTAEYWDGGIPWITPKDLSGFDQIYIENGSRDISQTGMEKSSVKILPTGTVLYTSRAPIGYIAIARVPVTTNQGFKSLVLHEGYVPEFIYYLLKNSKSEIESHSSGGTFAEISARALADVELELPDKRHQFAIAEVLLNLDRKILANKSLSKTLENIAQAIFKSWFIDFDPVKAKMAGDKPVGVDDATAALFPDSMEDSELDPIPRGWKLSQIGDEVECVGGSTPSTSNSEFWDGDICWTTPKDLSKQTGLVTTSSERRITIEGVEKISSGVLPVHSVLMSSRAPIGYLSINAVPSAINQGFIALRQNQKFTPLYLLFWLQMNMAEIKNRAGGGTFAEISKSAFKSIPFVVPDKETLKKFGEISEPILLQLTALALQNQELIELRDSLLPRLISGELQIPEEMLVS